MNQGQSRLAPCDGTSAPNFCLPGTSTTNHAKHNILNDYIT